jgi:hypothetical protein
MGPRNAYKDMLNNLVGPIIMWWLITKIKLGQKAYGAMFATILVCCTGDITCQCLCQIHLLNLNYYYVHDKCHNHD